MKSTPLLMKGPLVRATLAGVKTETRRLIEHIPAMGYPQDWCHRINEPEFKRIVGDCRRFCPYGGPGDRLWIRETWAHLGNGGFGYRADVDTPRDLCWQPSIHMPRRACRLELELDSVSIEFVQDITDAAIRAEGVADLTLDELLEMGASRRAIVACVAVIRPHAMVNWWTWEKVCRQWPGFADREIWQIVWDLIYGADPATCWLANPPVWVLKYRKVTT